MEGCSLHSPTVTTLPSSITRTGFTEKPFVHGQILKFPNVKKYPHARNFKFHNLRAQASGTTKFSSETLEAIPKGVDLKDENLAFVAGATGNVGSRTVRELLKLGFQVRAGVRSAEKAKALVQSVKQMRLDTKNASEGAQPVEKLEIVECDLEKRDEIGPALGNASVVLCCIGASEKEVFDITGPYRIDYLATKNLIEAATIAKVNHFILLTSLGTNKVGFPAALLNLFWGVLIWKRKAEEALIASGLPYTIVRPGGMERPTDAYKETHNTTLSQEDTLFGGQVSNLQYSEILKDLTALDAAKMIAALAIHVFSFEVAELMAFMAKNCGLSYCKVVEVIAETTAPLTPLGELLTKIPSQRAPPKESSAASGSQPSPSKSEEPSASLEKKAEPIATQSLSPYTVYEDLKPPSSPSPTPSGPKEIPINVSTAEVVSPPSGGNDVAEVNPNGVPETVSPQISSIYRSPYYVYDDFKPPTSPSPNAPSLSPVSPSAAGNDGVSPTSTSSVNNTVQLATGDEPGEKQHRSEPKPRPLSPFTMYEDLKPPASPSPSLK